MKPKIVLTTLFAAMVVASCTSAASQATTTARTAGPHPARLVVWSVNSDGPYFRAILTGAVGDYGPGKTVHPDGTVDPEHTSELELDLSRGSFRLSIAKIDAEFARDFTRFPYDRATCSVHGTVSGTAPVVVGSGTGAYRGIAGTFALVLSADEVDVRQAGCDGMSSFAAQLLLMEGTGSIRR
jgi:hypothetical protein